VFCLAKSPGICELGLLGAESQTSSNMPKILIYYDKAAVVNTFPIISVSSQLQFQVRHSVLTLQTLQTLMPEYTTLHILKNVWQTFSNIK
jgi:hypothetical protein